MTETNRDKMRRMVAELLTIQTKATMQQLETTMEALGDVQVDDYRLPKAFLHAAYTDLAARAHPYLSRFRELADQMKTTF